MTAALCALAGLWLGWFIAATPRPRVEQPEPTVDFSRHVQQALWVARRTR